MYKHTASSQTASHVTAGVIELQVSWPAEPLWLTSDKRQNNRQDLSCSPDTFWFQPAVKTITWKLDIKSSYYNEHILHINVHSTSNMISHYRVSNVFNTVAKQQPTKRLVRPQLYTHSLRGSTTFEFNLRLADDRSASWVSPPPPGR